MKKGWEYKRLEECCDINYGTRVVREKDSGTIYDVYGGGGATFKTNSYNREDCVVVSRFAMSKKCTRYISGRFFLNDSGLTVSPKKDSKLSQLLLNKFLLALNDTIYSFGRGSAQRNLNVKEFSKILIAFPEDLYEQQRIVSYLDAEFSRIETLKTNAEKQLQATKDLFQSALKELLMPKEGWEIVNIGDVFKSYSGGTPIKSHQEYYNNATIPWLNSGEVCQKYITSTSNYINELGLKNSSAKYFPVNTVLVAMYGATAAQAGILKFEATSNQAVCGLLPTKEMLPEFVYYWFLYNKTEFASMAQGGAQPNLSQTKIKAMPIPFIEIKQQQSICDILDALEERIKQLQMNYTEAITLCNDLKQALLKQVFE